MPLQVTGVQFVNQGLSTALGGLNQYINALVKTTQTVVNSTQTWNKEINNVATNNSKSFTLIGSITNSFSSSVSKGMAASTEGVRLFGKGLLHLIEIATGFIILKRIINDVLDTLRNLWDSMIVGASQTELLTIRFESLLATSIQNTQGIEDFDRALAMARGPAADLLEWVNQFAVKTMFSRDDIAQVLALGMAFDLDSKQAQTLTIAMADWASGMGLGQDALQRMIVNFGQMMRMGKITQRELRDLAIGGLFPVNEALRRIGERAGLTGDALKDFMQKTATSGMPVNALLTEFVAIAEERFPNAAERLAKTWQGVTQNIKDFVTTVLGASLLGPTMNKLVLTLSDLLDKALSPSVRGTAKVIGETLANTLEKIVRSVRIFMAVLGDLLRMFGIVMPSINQLIASFELFGDIVSSGLNTASSAIRNWIDKSEASFSEASARFMDWGFNLIANFSIGIVQAISTVLVIAMNLLSSALAFFLGPGSPPRVAPNIDIWGESAMNEFLKGMTNADFDILKDLQGPLQSALNVMAQLGLIAKDQVGTIFYDLSKQIIEAIHQLETTGTVGEEVFAAIRRAGGELGDELEELARRQFALLAATRELEKVQEELNNARKADTTAKSRVDALVKEYRDLVAAGASKDVLETKRAEIKAAMDERQATKENVLLAEDKVATAKEAIDPLKQQVDLQEKLVQQMIALAQAQAQAQESAAGAGGGGSLAEQFGAMGDALKGFQADMLATQVKLAFMQRSIRLRVEEIKTDIKEKLSGAFQPVIDIINNDFMPAINRIKGAFATLKTYLPKGGLFSGIFGGSGGSIATLAGKILGVVVSFKLLAGVLKIVLSPFTGLLGIIGTVGAALLGLPATLGTVGLVLGGIGLVVGGLALAWNEDFLGMRTAVTEWAETNKEKINEIITEFQQGKIGEALGDLGQVIIDWIKSVDWAQVGTNLATTVGEGLSSIFKGAVDFGKVIVGWFNSIDWKLVVKEVVTTLGTGLGDLLKGAVNFVTIFVDWINGIDWMEVGKQTGEVIGKALSDLFTSVFKLADWILTYLATVNWNQLATSVWDFFGKALEAMFSVLGAALEVVAGLVMGFIAGIDWNAFGTAIWGFLGAALEATFSVIAGILGSIVRTIVNFVVDTINQVTGASNMNKPVNPNVPPTPTGQGTPTGPPPRLPREGYHWEWVNGQWVEIPGLAAGGLVTQRGLYELGEQGPEMVIRAGLTSQFFRGVTAMNSMVKGMTRVAASPIYNNMASNKVTNYNLSVGTAKSTGNVITDFSIMETLAG